MVLSPKSITTTLFPTVFTGNRDLDALSFKNGSSTGILYMKNTRNDASTVSSTNYDFSLTAGQSISMVRATMGDGIDGPWDAISDTAGGVNLEIVQLYKATRSR